MALTELSLEQAPPFSVPLRFFLSAPLFALLAAAVLAVSGPDAFASRWTPAVLAATHLLTLGFLGMCMLGALTQMLPVLAGAVIAAPRRLAWLTHTPLAAGTLLLAGGFLFAWRAALFAALVLLAWALSLFVLTAGLALVRSAARTATVRAMQLALVALAVTVLLGVLLGLGMTGAMTLPLPRLADVHLGWGLLGWMGLLILGVAYQVVPMFQMTPAYPDFMQRTLAPALLGSLLAWSLSYGFDAGVWRWIAALGLLLAFVLFAWTTLRLQRQRRRRLPDVTLRFWRVGMLSMSAAALLWSSAQLVPEVADAPFYPLLLGLLWIVGFGLSIVEGMLYKIVPFLVWLHLQNRRLPRGTVPNMKEIIEEAAARRQAGFHEAALVLLLAAAVQPAPLIYLAALAGGLSAWLLAWNLAAAWRVYRRHAGQKPRP